jgi:hypothetical protein
MENEALDFEGEAPKVPTYKSIGGWLILPMIGLFITPFSLTISTFNNLLPAINSGNLAAFDDPTSGLYNPILKYLVYAEVCFNLSFALYAIIIIVYAFRYKAQTPTLYIVFLIGNFTFLVLDHIAIVLLDLGDLKSFLNLDSFRAFVSCAIWVPYFLLSERVKGTFVK